MASTSVDATVRYTFDHSTANDGPGTLPTITALDRLTQLITYLGTPGWLPSPSPNDAIAEEQSLFIYVNPYGWRVRFRSSEMGSGYDETGSGPTLEAALETHEGFGPDLPEVIIAQREQAKRALDPWHVSGQIFGALGAVRWMMSNVAISYSKEMAEAFHHIEVLLAKADALARKAALHDLGKECK